MKKSRKRYFLRTYHPRGYHGSREISEWEAFKITTKLEWEAWKIRVGLWVDERRGR